MAEVRIYQGEAKTLPFRIKDKKTRQALDLTDAIFLLGVKRSPDDVVPLFTKVDEDFDKTAAASGYVTTVLSAYDTWREPWTYQAELRVIRAGDPALVDKLHFDLEILPAVTPNDWTLQPTGISSLEALGTPAVTIS
jgi:hypothetical protein